MLLNSKESLKCKMLTLKCLAVASTRHHLARFLKYYPRRPCAPSFVKSRILRPQEGHFLLFQQIFFILVCIHAGNPRVPLQVLASAKTLRGQSRTATTFPKPQNRNGHDHGQVAAFRSTQVAACGGSEDAKR